MQVLSSRFLLDLGCIQCVLGTYQLILTSIYYSYISERQKDFFIEAIYYLPHPHALPIP